MDYILNAGLLILSFICILGIFARKFNDWLFQRIGLSLTACGCLLMVYARLNGFDTVDETRLRILGLSGVIVFAITTTTIKIWKKNDPA